ncbi:hypothetical protein Ciccas_009378 [Cichlidogyrus casuarinus]|uniref:Protein kinase domain-containing protein n=1 Tax=Cichlidogyrus casuarinus TaxID=1844966 RepID=A0ABD2Q1N3_9PLAT
MFSNSLPTCTLQLWLPPELLSTGRPPTYASDVFMLARLIQELFHPIEFLTNGLAQVEESRIPPGLQLALNSTLKRNPEERLNCKQLHRVILHNLNPENATKLKPPEFNSLGKRRADASRNASCQARIQKTPISALKVAPKTTFKVVEKKQRTRFGDEDSDGLIVGSLDLNFATFQWDYGPSKTTIVDASASDEKKVSMVEIEVQTDLSMVEESDQQKMLQEPLVYQYDPMDNLGPSYPHHRSVGELVQAFERIGGIRQHNFPMSMSLVHTGSFLSPSFVRSTRDDILLTTHRSYLEDHQVPIYYSILDLNSEEETSSASSDFFNTLDAIKDDCLVHRVDSPPLSVLSIPSTMKKPLSDMRSRSTCTPRVEIEYAQRSCAVGTDNEVTENVMDPPSGIKATSSIVVTTASYEDRGTPIHEASSCYSSACKALPVPPKHKPTLEPIQQSLPRPTKKASTVSDMVKVYEKRNSLKPDLGRHSYVPTSPNQHFIPYRSNSLYSSAPKASEHRRSPIPVS